MHIEAWPDGAAIPAEFAFGKPGVDGPFAPSDNLNPAVSWSGAPEGCKSYAIICRDVDVPSSGEDVNQVGKTVPAGLPRVDFFHWVLVDIPANVTSIAQGAVSKGITARGKAPSTSEYGISGQNDYTGWFAGDADMAGTYGGYDGPCPPWNDSIVHRYYFELYALDIESTGLQGNFTGQQALDIIHKHTLVTVKHMGTYSMNPRVKT